MKTIIITFLLLTLWVTTGLSIEEKSDAVYEKITIEYTLNEDGSQEYRYYKKLRLITHLSFNRLYGETFIVYNPEFQKLKINLAQTTHADGKVTRSPENAFNEVLPSFASRAPFYNHLREMVVTHTGTELDAVIELDYVLQTKSGYFPGLMANEILTETSPILNKEIIIKIPANLELHFKVFNYRTAPEISTEGNTKVFRFSFNGVREDTHETNQPVDHVHLPRLIFSTVSWEDAIDHLITQSDLDLKPTKEMKEEVKSLRTENKYDLPFILNLNKAIVEEINHYPVPWQYSGFRMRNPADVWQSNGGMDFEKSLLFAGLLKEGGVHAVPVIVVPAELFDEKIGCLFLVKEFLVQVNPRELEQIYLSAVATSVQNRIFSLTGNTVITIDLPIRKETIEDVFENKVVVNGSVNLTDSLTLSGKFELLLSESVNPYYQVEQDTNALKSVIGGLSANTEVRVELINAAQYRTLAQINLQSKGALKKYGSYFVFELPANMMGTEKWNIRYLHGRRLTPFELPNTIDEQYSYSIKLPAGVRLVNPVELIGKSAPFGELVIYITQSNDEIIVKKMLILTQKIISSEDYPAFKEMMDLWNEKNFKKLYLTKG